MKKTLLSLFIVVAAVFGLNAATVIEATSFGFSANTDLTGVNATLKNSGFTLTFAKGNSTTNPTFNKTSGEFRLYGGSKDTDKVAGNTMTITGTKLTSVVLTAGSKPTTWSKTITASTGTVEIDSVSHNLTWKGDAASVTFTICRNATDLTKAVQYRFKTITIEGEGGGSTPDPEVKYLEIKTLEDFYSAPLDTTVKFTGTLNVVYQSGRNLIVTDASKYSMQIYCATGYETTYKTGDVIPAGTTGKVTEFAGNKQIDVIEIAAPSSTTTVTPTVVKVSELPDVEPYLFTYVKVEGVNLTNDPNNSKKIRYYQVSDGEATFTVYDQFLVNQKASNDTVRKVALEEGVKYDVVGILSTYRGAQQMYLVSFNKQGETPANPGDLNSIKEFYETTEKEVTFVNPLNVIFQKNSNLLVTDASGYNMLIYGSVKKTFKNGDIIAAGTKGTVGSYSNILQLTNATVGDATGTTTVEPMVKKVSELAGVEPYQYAYVKINDVTVTNDPNNSTSLRYYQLSDGEATFIAYDSYLVNQTSSSATERIRELEEGKKYNIVGVLSSYKNNKQLNLISIEVSSGVDEVEVEDNTPVEYYNLNGVKVGADNLTPGIYVSKKGNKVTKVLVK